MEYIQITWTSATLEEAKRIAQSLVALKLVACAQISPQIESIYLWKGQIESSQEVKVTLKTLRKHFDAVVSLIQKECSYEVPEILAVTVDLGSASYLEWMRSCL